MPRSHAGDKRQSAVAMLAKGGSLRAVAAAHGVGKSTVQRWQAVAHASGGATNIVAAHSSASASALGGEENEAPATKGGAYSPGTPATAALPYSHTLPEQDATTEPHVQGEAEYHHLDATFQPPHESVLADRMHNPYFLRALHRYLNLCATGTRPDVAMEGAQMIDPYFTLAWPEDQQLRGAAQKFIGAETEKTLFAQYAPLWVSQMARDYQFTDRSMNDLLDALSAVRTDGWLAGINANLDALGRPKLSEITDAGLLRDIQLDSADTVNAVTKTWNADVAAQVWKLWEQSPGMAEEDLRAQLSDWLAGRIEWKSQQWSFDEASQGMFDAAKRFHQENNVAITGRVEPGDAVCPACQEAVDLGEVDADVLLSLDLPLHPGCPHEVTMEMAEITADRQLWGEDLGPAEEEAA